MVLTNNTDINRMQKLLDDIDVRVQAAEKAMQTTKEAVAQTDARVSITHFGLDTTREEFEELKDKLNDIDEEANVQSAQIKAIAENYDKVEFELRKENEALNSRVEALEKALEASEKREKDILAQINKLTKELRLKNNPDGAALTKKLK